MVERWWVNESTANRAAEFDGAYESCSINLIIYYLCVLYNNSCNRKRRWHKLLCGYAAVCQNGFQPFGPFRFVEMTISIESKWGCFRTFRFKIRCNAHRRVVLRTVELTETSSSETEDDLFEIRLCLTNDVETTWVNTMSEWLMNETMDVEGSKIVNWQRIARMDQRNRQSEEKNRMNED